MSNWRESRLFLAISFCISGFLAAAAITFTYVLPVYQKQDSNEISELKNKINKLESSNKEEVDSLNNTIASQKNKNEELQTKKFQLESEINNYKNKLISLSMLSTFQHGQALPIGYSSILPGMKLSDVEKKYGKDKLDIDPEGRVITVKVESGGIDTIMYSSGSDTYPGVITAILVSKYDLDTLVEGMNSSPKDNEQLLLNLLQENLGHNEGCSAGEYIWPLDNYRYVYYNSRRPYFYEVFFGGVYAPGTSSKCLKVMHESLGKDE